MSSVSRGDYVWGVSLVVILGAFLIFVAAGWPDDPNDCIYKHPNKCFCEAFNRIDVIRGSPGVRQPVNTWFNLYAIFTSLIVAVRVHYDRKSLSQFGDVATSPNLMRSQSFVPDMYIFAVLFLGLGSMWFHGSLKKFGSITDQLSMFVYTVFLPFYTFRRLCNSKWVFWFGYTGMVALFTVIDARWKFDDASLVLIVILVGIYLVLQAILWVRTWDQMSNKLVRIGLLWGGAALAIIVATLAWIFSQTGKDWCDPSSFFQPHGLIWHPFAGVMAVLLYFYWRGDES